uniref:Uncharacterized protein n=1 Tax=Arundo donax TaxID=35708 RepID=A0A0A9ALZ5_ARUDO
MTRAIVTMAKGKPLHFSRIFMLQSCRN